jgi:hypothetical protein
VGVLFIIGTVAGILSVVVTGSILADPEYLIKVSANENQIIIGALLVLIMGFALAMVPVMLFPIFKKYNEALALGAVVFRGALEAVAYIAALIRYSGSARIDPVTTTLRMPATVPIMNNTPTILAVLLEP